MPDMQDCQFLPSQDQEECIDPFMHLCQEINIVEEDRSLFPYANITDGPDESMTIDQRNLLLHDSDQERGTQEGQDEVV